MLGRLLHEYRLLVFDGVRSQAFDCFDISLRLLLFTGL